MRIIGIPEEEREKEAKCLFKKIIAENFLNLGEDLGIQVYEPNRSPIYITVTN